jgi:hypothetical protein
MNDENMKCLSIKQPYADLVTSGRKTIELRTWNTKFRGEFLVHASKKIDKEACKQNKIDPASLTSGAIVGQANLYDVKFYKNRNMFVQDKKKHLAESKYSDHKYGFLIKNATKFRRPLLMAGKLGFFNVEYEQY